MFNMNDASLYSLLTYCTFSLIMLISTSCCGWKWSAVISHLSDIGRVLCCNCWAALVSFLYVLIAPVKHTSHHRSAACSRWKPGTVLEMKDKSSVLQKGSVCVSGCLHVLLLTCSTSSQCSSCQPPCGWQRVTRTCTSTIFHFYKQM